MKYEDYHTHYINRLIHFFCIPLIVLSSYNFISYYTNIFVKTFILCSLLIYYSRNYNLTTSFVMYFYYMVVEILSYNWLHRKFCLRESFWIFLIAWILQFWGHAIEGNRPALFTSLIHSFTEAPLFSIQYVLPFRIH